MQYFSIMNSLGAQLDAQTTTEAFQERYDREVPSFLWGVYASKRKYEEAKSMSLHDRIEELIAATQRSNIRIGLQEGDVLLLNSSDKPIITIIEYLPIYSTRRETVGTVVPPKDCIKMGSTNMDFRVLKAQFYPTE